MSLSSNTTPVMVYTYGYSRPAPDQDDLGAVERWRSSVAVYTPSSGEAFPVFRVPVDMPHREQERWQDAADMLVSSVCAEAIRDAMATAPDRPVIEIRTT